MRLLPPALTHLPTGNDPIPGVPVQVILVCHFHAMTPEERREWTAKGGRARKHQQRLRADRDVLRAACAAAEAAGVLLVAASAARGAPVFPAAYPGVLRVSGDARCGPEEVSDLEGEPAHFGASPVASGATGLVGGASFACARVSGMLAAVLAREPGLGAPAVLARLRALARYRGRERRGVA